MRAAVFTLTCSLAAAADWTFMYERDGFRAYEQRGKPAAYRAEGTVDVDLAEVAAVLVDFQRHREWVSHLAESRLLSGDALGHHVAYSRYDLPWPATDRDAVIEGQVAMQPKAGTVHVRFHAAPSPLAPPRRDCIRVPVCDGDFTLHELGRGRVQVTYTIRLDPGGWLPAWLVRHFVRDAPATTLRAFRAQVLRTRGQYDGWIAVQRAAWERDKAR